MGQGTGPKKRTAPPAIEARRAAVLEHDGLKFKDLNHNGRLDPYEDWRRPVEERVEDLLGRMTLEEKAGLMFHPPVGMGAGGALQEEPDTISFADGESRVVGPGTTDGILHKHIRHVLSRSADRPEILAAWNNSIQELAEGSRLGIPVTVSSDPRNGFQDDPQATSVRSEGFSRWPDPIGLAATHDEALVEQFGAIAAREYRATGIRLALHPMADLATEPRWGRISGTFGEDAVLASRLVSAYIRGFQGKNGLNAESVATMTKHFPGGGPQLKGLDPHNDYGREQVYPGNNFDYHLIPFRAALEAGTAQIMPYYGIPVGITGEDVGMGFNREIITGLLRQKLGFDGVVCTDWSIVSMMCWGVEDLSIPARVKKAIDAGVDQFGGEYIPEVIVGLVNRHEVSEARIDRSVRRLLGDIFRLGLFENPYVVPDEAAAIVGNREFQAAGDLAQRRSIVLLTNKTTGGGRQLPLTGGTRIYIENIDPATAAAYGPVTASPDDAEAAILRVNAPFETGPGFFGRFFHQGSLAFPAAELARLLEIIRRRPTIVAIHLDRPAVIPEIAAEAAAVLGTFGADDRALLDIIFGKFRPTGRLPFELPSSMEAVKRQREDVPCDSENPLFKFGHGLTY